MKKTVLAVIFGLLVYGQTFAQSEPIMGYDKVKWGASVLDVRKAYNLGNSYVLQERYENNPDIAALVQTNVSDSIKERIFMFNKWKGNYQLYRVWVTYWNDSTLQNLLTGLASRFGDRTDFRRDSQGNNIWNLIVMDTATFGKHSPELVVELIHTSGSGAVIHDGSGNVIENVGHGSSLQVCYTWKRFRDEYQTRNVQF